MVKRSDLNGTKGYKLVSTRDNGFEFKEETPEEEKQLTGDTKDGDGVRMKAELPLLNGCTIIVGSIIGSGIFIAPGGVLKQTGSVNMSLTVWILSGLSTLLSPVIENTMSLYLMPGLYSMIGAYCYAELGLLIRKVSIDYDSL